MIKPRGQTSPIRQLRISPKNIKRSGFQKWNGKRKNRSWQTCCNQQGPVGRFNGQKSLGDRFIIAFSIFVAEIKMPAVLNNRAADRRGKIISLVVRYIFGRRIKERARIKRRAA